MTPRDLVGSIANESGISSDQIGKIELRDTHSIVEISTPVAEQVASKMNGITVRGKRLTMRVDNDRPSSRTERGERGEHESALRALGAWLATGAELVRSWHAQLYATRRSRRAARARRSSLVRAHGATRRGATGRRARAAPRRRRWTRFFSGLGEDGSRSSPASCSAGRARSSSAACAGPSLRRRASRYSSRISMIATAASSPSRATMAASWRRCPSIRRCRSRRTCATTRRSSRWTRRSSSMPGSSRSWARMAARGARVILAGTDTDFRGEPFGPMPQLMAVADLVDKLHAICVVCGGPASRNQRLIDGRPARYDSPTIMVGGRESYEARCRHCHELPRRDEDQVPLL